MANTVIGDDLSKLTTVNKFLQRNLAEATLAVRRLIQACGPAGADARHHAKMSTLLLARDACEYESDQYLEAQEAVDRAAAEKQAWSKEMCFELLEERAVAMSKMRLDDEVHRSGAELWDIAIVGPVLQNCTLPGMTQEDTLSIWREDGVGRYYVQRNLQSKSRTWNSLARLVNSASTLLNERAASQKFSDTVAAMGPLQSLRYCLSLLRDDISAPGNHIDSACLPDVLDHALTVARSVTRHWPVGAYEPIAERSRDAVMSPLIMKLNFLAQNPGVTEGVTQALMDAMSMLDSFIQPICKWPTIPSQVAARRIPSQNQPDLGWRDIPWFEKVTATNENGKLTAATLRRAANNGDFGKSACQACDGGPWSVRVQAVCDHPKFSRFAGQLIEAANAERSKK